MAFRRSITARAKLLYQHPRAAAPFPHIHQDDNDQQNPNPNNPISNNPVISNQLQRCLFGTGNNLGGSYRSRNLFHDRRFAIPAGCGPPVFSRNMSSIGERPSENIEIMTDMAEVFGDKVVEVASSQVGPVANEVALAAADSFMPVAALQYLIDYVHCYTGFNWWASIVVTTILIRWIQLPLMINTLKSTSKFTLLRPRLEEIKEDMQSRDMSPAAVAEGQERMKKLFKEYGVTPLTPLKGLLITGPIFFCFFLAVRNMAENVPSFKEGGAFWFTDLTTPDTMYIFPILTALTFWITVECNTQDGMEGNPTAGTIKNVSRVFAVLTVPFTAMFPKAIFCYWITSNLFSLAYGLVLKKPGVKEFLGVPVIPVEPPSPDQKPALSFFDSIKKYAEAQQKMSLSKMYADAEQKNSLQSEQQPAEIPSLKPANEKKSGSPTLRQRIRDLENEVKERKKLKKKI
ncbi:hypothetical protein ABFS82_05G110500 [Erythranthe guttata]|nr:PREDICTED: mitochondrial inner membrane protein OXA1-like [Erythranthe guttata]|eukprot:XP_012834264.1 PREDICTED: mitochondrial inner membrane protein OXA1-like [Erythranthe guttata]